jgi:hypothetical protein
VTAGGQPGVASLPHEQVRAALRLLGEQDPPVHRGTAQRLLREILGGYGVVRSLVERAPDGARAAFIVLVQDGPAPVEQLLGRGWWGRGSLPPPLDWLQRRALITVDDGGLVHPVEEARAGFADLTLDLDVPVLEPVAEPLRVESAGCVVVASTPRQLDRALGVTAAQLRSIAPTVAFSAKSAEAVTAALRGAGVTLAADQVVAASTAAPALPGTAEDAVGPRAIRSLLQRAMGEARQVRLEYFASSRGGAATDRVVDPWEFRDDLLRGYCHLREGERTFAVDRIGRARLLATAVDHQPF